MVRRALLFIAVLIPCLCATAAAPPAIPEVTVTAPKPPDAEQLAGDSVPRFIAKLGKPAILTGQLARWAAGICPLTEGLEPAFNAFVSARVQAVAASVGAPLADRAPCGPNVAIYFTAKPQALLDEVVKHASQLLGFHYPHQTRKLATVSRPIQSWYVTGIRGASGEDVVDDIWGMAPGGRGTRLSTGRSSLIMFVLIVADTNKVSDFSVGSISDYIAILALSRPTSLDGCEPLPSIIDLMSPICGKESMSIAITAGDSAYLKALYKISAEEPLSLQRTDIRDYMMREFAKD